MGGTNASYIMTFANSIIGVSILAMPYCFKQCGVALASLILILSSVLTRLSCHYLLKSAIMSRRRNFEFLAFHVFGSTGKMAIELSIIFLMMGTCIAFFVVMGDLGPEIVGTLVNYNNSAALRPSVLIGLAVFVVLPLGMLRNVDSLGTICTASFVFYFCLVLKIFMESTTNLVIGDWINDIHYWRPSGILQCAPIFSMALSCQTQLFEIFDSLSGATLDRMNAIIKSAVNLCTGLYISVGFFGYIAYYKQNFSGNVLMSFSPALSSDVIKIGFVLSVAVTFPLVIFPCRASMNSLLFRKAHVPHYEFVQGGGNHIPEARFKCITLFIITLPLTIGLLAPNIEIVLGLLGSTIGVVICVLFPPLIFIHISSKATSERLVAQIVFAIGIFIMVMGTYTNLYLTNEDTNLRKDKLIETPANSLPPIIVQDKSADSSKASKIDPKVPVINPEQQQELRAEVKSENVNKDNKLKEPPMNIVKSDRRKEPPFPEAPDIPILVESSSLSGDNKNVLTPRKGVIVKPADKVSEIKQNLDKQNANDRSPIGSSETVENNVQNPHAKLDPPDAVKKPAGPSVNINDNNNVVNDEKERVLLNQADVSKSGDDMLADNTIKKAPPENISALVKDSIPLPIAVNQNKKSDNSNDNHNELSNAIQRRDILQKISGNDNRIRSPIEREKRDLEFVSTVSNADSTKTISNQIVEPLSSLSSIEESFVKNIAQQQLQPQQLQQQQLNDNCPKNNNETRETDKLKSQIVSEKDVNISNKRIIVLSSSDDKPNKSSDESRKKKPDDAETLSQEDAIVIPSRLSIPEVKDVIDSVAHSVVLSQAGQIDKDVPSESAATSLDVRIKPMKRDLKSIDENKSTSSDEKDVKSKP